jgi:hypothetical protein
MQLNAIIALPNLKLISSLCRVRLNFMVIINLGYSSIYEGVTEFESLILNSWLKHKWFWRNH